MAAAAESKVLPAQAPSSQPSWPILYLVRPGATPPGDYLGWVVPVPGAPSARAIQEAGGPGGPGGLSKDDALEWALKALGIPDLLVGIGQPARLVALGFVQMSSWERDVIDWVARRVGLPADIAPSPTDRPCDEAFQDVARVFEDPLGTLQHRDRERVHWVEGADPELEALGVARLLRDRLNRVDPERWPSLWSSIQVLLPGANSRRAAWERALARCGLPVVEPRATSLADTGAGRWLVRLLDLCPWGHEPVPRAALQAVLDSPFVTLPETGRRSDLRQALRTLRRHRIDLAGWLSHLEGYFQALREDASREGILDDAIREGFDQRFADLVQFSKGAAAALGEPGRPDFPKRLRAFVRSQWQGRTRPGPDDANIRAATQCLDLLEAMEHDAGAMEALAGQDSHAAIKGWKQWLAEGVASRSLGRGTVPREGVRLQSYLAWDGRPSDIVVLAGLEEGGFPALPERRSEADEAWSAVLGLPSPAEDLLRHARIASAAARSSGSLLLLSSSRADEAGAETFPGALLAAFEADDDAVRKGAALPGQAYAALRVTDAEAVAPEVAQTLQDAAFVPQASAWPGLPPEARPELEAVETAATHSQRVQAARAPETDVPMGPYTGDVAVNLAASPVSATALEALGQCGIRYFLGRVLGIESVGDSGVTLEPSEQGAWVHDAFARCLGESGVWDLRMPETTEEERDAWLEGQRQWVRKALDDERRLLSRRNPTFSPGLLRALQSRWEMALDGWLSKLGKAGPALGVTTAPDPETADPATLERLVAGDGEAAKALDSWRRKRKSLDAVVALLERVTRAPLPSKAEADRQKREADNGASLIPAGQFQSIAVTVDDGARAEWCALQAEKAKASVPDALAKLKAALQKIVNEDRQRLPLRVVAAEHDFGSVPPPLSLDLGEGMSLGVRGRIDRIDRIDRNENSAVCAVVDYKTGKGKTQGQLRREVGAGLHLQLPLYALALEAQGLQGDPVEVHVAALDFPRKGRAFLDVARDAGPEMQVADPDGGTGDDPLNMREVARRHLSHAAFRLAEGLLPLSPRSCPLLGPGNQSCDFGTVCGFDPEARGTVLEPRKQPGFVPVPRPRNQSKSRKSPPFRWQAPGPVAPPPTAREGEERLKGIGEVVRDLAKDLVVEAGAGSGKTYSLVERYVAALQAGASPNEVLCITFTRKAATEMRVRIRKRVRQLPSVDRGTASRWLMELGTAPILTFDAFARLLVTEARGDAPPLGSALGAWVREWVEGAVAEESSRDPADPRLQRLLDALPPAAVIETLDGLLRDEGHLQGFQATSADLVMADWRDALGVVARDLDRDARDLEEEVRGLSSKPDLAASDREILGQIAGWLRPIRDTLAHADVSPALEALAVLWNQDRGDWKAAAEEVSGLVLACKTWRDERAGSKSWFGKLRGAEERARKRALEDPSVQGETATATPGRIAAGIFDLLRGEAEITASAIGLARDWLPRLQEARRSGTGWTFDDIAGLALEVATERPLPPWARTALTPDAPLAASDIARRFPFRHMLVDEFQDTDGRQLALLEALRATLGRAGISCRRFIVGDPKQSIYRFRGAEVDLFQREARQAAPGTLVHLPTCHRAVPSLTRAFDRLFERLFQGARAAPGPGEEALLDPEAAVPWAPMAPVSDEADGPAIELLTLPEPVVSADAQGAEPSVAQESAEDPDEETDGESGDTGEAQEGADIPALERAVAERIRAIRTESPDETVAVLTHSWARALHYGRKLREQGIPAWVQGGRGLLATPEVSSLLQWMSALDSADDDLAWAGMLRGPTVGVSDPGLLCLRRGYGLELRAWTDAGEAWRPAWRSNPLSALRYGFRFDAGKAATDLAAASRSPLRAGVQEALQNDAARLIDFGKTWDAAREAYGFLPLADVMDAIVRDTRYEAILARRFDGVEALANLRRFLSLLRDVEGSGEASLLPREVLARLRDLLEAGEDPATAGVAPDAGGGVEVTVVHQAKGREWDVVVVPDLHRATVKGRVAGMGLLRFPPAFVGGEGSPARVMAGSQVTHAKDPFRSTGGLGASILGAASRFLERAESRRLLYVAMTRAKKRLILSANWPGAADVEGFVSQADGLPVGLRHSGGWMHDLVFALRLKGRELAGDVWNADTDFVWKEYPDLPAQRPQGIATAVRTRLPSDPEALVRACTTMAVPVLRRLRPSDAHAPSGARVPPDVTPAAERTSPALRGSPLPAKQEGTLVHRTFQEWGYAGDLGDDVLDRAVEAARGAGEKPSVRQWLDRFIHAAIDAQPDLVRSLREAAAEGRVHHEVRLVITYDDCRVVGAIDLLVRERDGAWQVYDYKTDDPGRGPTEADRLAAFVQAHQGQVALYAQALPKLDPPAPVSRVVLWRLKTGQRVGW